MSRAVYAFSGDPITYGHIDIVERAKKVFDEVIVAIGINPEKNYTFNLPERKKMAEKCFRGDPNIKVMSFSNMLVDFAYEQGADVIVKGVRNAADFNYENVLDSVGKSQEVGIDTHILFADPELTCVSSSVVKEIAKYNGEMTKYVPMHVKQAIEEKVNEQTIIGLTGEICCGKSHIGEVLSDWAINIELDLIAHEILGELTEPAYVKVREKIQSIMGYHVMDSHGFIKRNVLGAIVFNDSRRMEILNEILAKPIMVRLRQILAQEKGVILINCALLAEAELLHICNNNVLLVTMDQKAQKRGLMDRGLSESQIETRLACQYTASRKAEVISNRIDRDKHGHLWTIDNSDNLSDDEIQNKFGQMVAEINDDDYGKPQEW